MSISRRPVIGITTRRMETGALRLDVVERAYGEAVAKAGGIPHLLPCSNRNPTEGDVAALDGLLLTGGGDVDPTRYGQLPAAETGGVDPERDAWEIGLVCVALESAVPLLGICRGCQVLNVACGGTLFQHLPARSDLPHLVAPRTSEVHAIEIQPDSRLFAVEGTTSIGTNSIHHQAVDELGAVLRATAWAEDGTVEAIEHLVRPAVGVQWHPENLVDHESHLAVFKWLVDQAA
jgi:putative glutamine amidotransferase